MYSHFDFTTFRFHYDDAKFNAPQLHMHHVRLTQFQIVRNVLMVHLHIVFRHDKFQIDVCTKALFLFISYSVKLLCFLSHVTEIVLLQGGIICRQFQQEYFFYVIVKLSFM